MSTKITGSTKILLPLAILLTIGAVPMIIIAAAPNYETLIEFGRRLYGEELAWTLPAATIGYELLATITYFLMPAHLATVRRTAAIGAVAGFGLTVVLAMAWVIIEGGPDVAMKVIMKIVPSGVVAGYMHLVVNVWHAVETAKEREAITLPAPVLPPVSTAPSQAEIEAMVATQVEAALAEVAKLMLPPEPPEPVAKPVPTPDPKPATRRVARPSAVRQEPVIAKPAIATPEPVAPVAVLPETQDEAMAIFQAEIAALPETPAEPIAEPVAEPVASEPGNLLTMPWKELRKLLPAGLSAAEQHVELAMKIIREAGDQQHELKSGKILKRFHGIQDRQVRNALTIARIRMGLESLPA